MSTYEELAWWLLFFSLLVVSLINVFEICTLNEPKMIHDKFGALVINCIFLAALVVVR